MRWVMSGLLAATIGAALMCGCPEQDSQVTLPDTSPGYKNTSDSSNGGARHVGSSSCAQCHAETAENVLSSAHPWALNRAEGGPPQFPAEAGRAGVPNPPEGFAWTDVSYVHGGYRKGAIFVGQDGFVLTTGTTGVNTQWNLEFPPNGTSASFVPYAPGANAPLPYDYSCFRCHTTGAHPQDPNAPRFQDGRSGIPGTWAEPGVRCEACHGPGGKHFTTSGSAVVIDRAKIFVDLDGSQSCRECHASSQTDDRLIAARDGFVEHGNQWSELKASGGHASFACTICHDPHRSTTYDRAGAIRNTCTVCHTTATMAGHEGEVFRRGDYVEPLTCESCHMPFAALAASSAGPAVVDPVGRIGDARTHIFRISTEPIDYTGMFTPDGTQVVRDAQGRAAVTVDFVCLRCHNDTGVPLFDPGTEVRRAAEIAQNVHRLP